MHEAELEKDVNIVAPAVVDGAAFTIAHAVDWRGWGHLAVRFICGVMADVVGEGGTSNPPILEECDTDSVTAGDWSEIAESELDAVLVATNNLLYRIDVNLMNGTRKRFIRPKAPTAGSTGAGAALCILGTLSKPQMGPWQTPAQRGLTEHVVV